PGDRPAAPRVARRPGVATPVGRGCARRPGRDVAPADARRPPSPGGTCGGRCHGAAGAAPAPVAPGRRPSGQPQRRPRRSRRSRAGPGTGDLRDTRRRPDLHGLGVGRTGGALVTGVAIVTGAARGIGAATVLAMARAGWSVVAVD